jgi:adenylate cyclase
VQRRLAAIMVADVADYTRLMGEDEAGTLAALNRVRSGLFQPRVAESGGNIIKRMGDGWIVEFPNVSAAVGCAIAVQEGLTGDDAIRLRIGIHIGDVAFQDDDIYGDGINVAARLEALAEPGQVAISDTAHHSLDGRTARQFGGGEVRQLKNVARPVGVWLWPADAGIVAPAGGAGATLPVQAKPSIAILPFASLSSDPEQAFFADGIVEDLITALSRFRWLLVIARNSSFSYKGRAVPVRQVAGDLGVRYVVEGSVRSSPSRLRVGVQLVDAESGHHIWAENYDRPAGDLFDLQDEISQAMTGVLVPALSHAERERSLRSNRPSLDAWQAFQRGLVHFHRPYSNEGHAAARRLFDEAVALDPSFADAHAMIALMGIYALDSGQSSYDASPADILDETERTARRAVQCDDSNALGRLVLGRVFGLRGDFESGVAECGAAASLNPNFAMAHHELGSALVWAGRYDEAIPCFERAIRLSPNDPSRWNFHLLKGVALTGRGELEAAIACFRDAARQRPAAFWPHSNMAACYAGLGRMDEAKAAVAEALHRKPDLSLGFFARIGGSAGKGLPHVQRILDGLTRAGLPA